MNTLIHQERGEGGACEGGMEGEGDYGSGQYERQPDMKLRFPNRQVFGRGLECHICNTSCDNANLKIVNALMKY